MPQATDIMLGGAGYMLVPGSYQRSDDGGTRGGEARAGRVSITAFGGGQRQALGGSGQQSANAGGGNDRSWDSIGVRAVYAGQGVEPWPAELVYTDNTVGSVTAAGTAPHLVVGDRAYVGIGRYLYRSAAAAATAWIDFAQVADAGAGKTITGLISYQGDVLLLLGTTGDILRYPTGGGATAVWTTGQKGTHGIGYRRRAIYSDPTNVDLLRLSTPSGIAAYDLDAPILGMGLFGGRVVIATRTSLYTLSGYADPTAAKWTEDPTPLLSHGEWVTGSDFSFLLGYAGKLYTWFNGAVQAWDGDRWTDTGLVGDACYGATIAGDRLIVAITTHQQNSELWAFDGRGWWLIVRAAATSTALRCRPMTTGGAGGWDVLVFRDGSVGVVYDLFRTEARSATVRSYKSTGVYQTSLLDAGGRDRLKAWRRVGASFAAPETRGNAASVDGVTVTLSYSIDGGKTFAVAASATVNDPTARLTDLEAVLGSNAVTSRWLVLKVTWTSVTDWAPVLVGLWADYERLETAVKRRRWRFKVQARDATITRDGGREPRSGRQLVADLWAAWEDGATLLFEDIDDDTSPITRAVQITTITEEAPKPADAGRWGESVVALTLEEV